MRHDRILAWASPLLYAVVLGACGEPSAPEVSDTSFYAVVQGIDGVYFYPPLGPEPTPHGTFDSTLLDGTSVTIESEDREGAITLLATFDQATSPKVALLGPQERYFVNIPAATYLTDPSKTYRIRVLLDGSELGSSVLASHAFEVLAWNPALPIGVHVRVEGSGAVRTLRRTRNQTHGLPAHCSDGVRNKDETGVDCGGATCAACATCSDGIQNQGETGVDCGGPCGPCWTPWPATYASSVSLFRSAPTNDIFNQYWSAATGHTLSIDYRLGRSGAWIPLNLDTVRSARTTQWVYWHAGTPGGYQLPPYVFLNRTGTRGQTLEIQPFDVDNSVYAGVQQYRVRLGSTLMTYFTLDYTAEWDHGHPADFRGPAVGRVLTSTPIQQAAGSMTLVEIPLD